MTSYAQFDESGSYVTQVNDKKSLPKSWTWPDGRITSNFHTLEDEELAEAGWFPVTGVDEPEFNSETHILSNEHIVLIEGVATRTWDVVERPPEPEPVEPVAPSPSVQDRLEALENELKEMKDRAKALNVTNADAVKIKNVIVND